MAPETAGPTINPIAKAAPTSDAPNAWLVLSDASPRIALQIPRIPVDQSE